MSVEKQPVKLVIDNEAFKIVEELVDGLTPEQRLKMLNVTNTDLGQVEKTATDAALKKKLSPSQE
ncbi:MAG: hypothetical protein WA021_04605 [Minisyncoccia bacterium]